MSETAPPPHTREFAQWLRAQRHARTPVLAQEKLAVAVGAERKAGQRWEKTGRIGLKNYLAVVAYFNAEPAATAVPPALTSRLAAVEAALDRLTVDIGALRMESRQDAIVEAVVAGVVAALKGRRDLSE